nr:MAG TPA: hypothetical protein [Caudoviricetes sp.]
MVEKQDWLNALTICPVCNAVMKRCASRRREEVQHGREARLAERADNLPGL